LALVRRVPEDVPHRLTGPDSLASGSRCTSLLKPTANLGKATAFLSDPSEYLLNYRGLLGDRLKSRSSAAFTNGDIAISKRRSRHHVERSALSCMLLTSPTSFHDFGSLIFSDDALEQQIIFRALAEWSV
jgi:hypothetical protein